MLHRCTRHFVNRYRRATPCSPPLCTNRVLRIRIRLITTSLLLLDHVILLPNVWCRTLKMSQELLCQGLGVEDEMLWKKFVLSIKYEVRLITLSFFRSFLSTLMILYLWKVGEINEDQIINHTKSFNYLNLGRSPVLFWLILGIASLSFLRGQRQLTGAHMFWEGQPT